MGAPGGIQGGGSSGLPPLSGLPPPGRPHVPGRETPKPRRNTLESEEYSKPQAMGRIGQEAFRERRASAIGKKSGLSPSEENLPGQLAKGAEQLVRGSARLAQPGNISVVSPRVSPKSKQPTLHRQPGFRGAVPSAGQTPTLSLPPLPPKPTAKAIAKESSAPVSVPARSIAPEVRLEIQKAVEAVNKEIQNLALGENVKEETKKKIVNLKADTVEYTQLKHEHDKRLEMLMPKKDSSGKDVNPLDALNAMKNDALYVELKAKMIAARTRINNLKNELGISQDII